MNFSSTQLNTGLVCVSGEVEIRRDVTLHVLPGLFAVQLDSGVTMTIFPLARERNRRAVSFLPIENPASVRAGGKSKLNVFIGPVEQFTTWVAGASSQFAFHTINPGDDERLGQTTCTTLTVRAQAGRSVLAGCDG